jgi:hypothetical protein
MGILTHLLLGHLGDLVKLWTNLNGINAQFVEQILGNGYLIILGICQTIISTIFKDTFKIATSTCNQIGVQSQMG